MTEIRIIAGEVSATAVLDDTPTARAILEALPIDGQANTWGDEIYFSIPVRAEQEPGAGDLVEVGDLGYWPPGSAFCIFFGRTPASQGDEARAASAVNVFGRIQGDATVFKQISAGAAVRIERVV